MPLFRRRVGFSDIASEKVALDAERVDVPDDMLARFELGEDLQRIVEKSEVVLDEGGVALLCSRHPDADGRVAVRVLVARDKNTNDDQFDGWFTVGPFRADGIRFNVKQAKAGAAVEAAVSVARQLIRLRTGGWHTYMWWSGWDSASMVRLFHPLDGTVYKEFKVKRRYSHIDRLCKNLQAMPSVPLRRCGDDVLTAARTVRELAAEDVDLTGLVQARYPDADGLRLAALIGAAYELHASGHSPSAAVAGAEGAFALEGVRTALVRA